jgi:hypothetical protein
VAFSQGGAIASIHTIPLLPLAEARDLQSDSASPAQPARTSSIFAASGR